MGQSVAVSVEPTQSHSPLGEPGRLAAAAPVVVDLIGDLDATLGELLADTLASLARAGESDIVVNFKHVEAVVGDGFGRVSRAITESRLGGRTIAVQAKDRRLRALFKEARLPYSDRSGALGARRHVLIGRHLSA